MNRRDFLSISGSSIISGTAILSGSTRSSAQLEFQISGIPDEDPSNIDSILVDFNVLDMKPQYIDDSKTASIKVSINLENGVSRSKEDEVLLINGQSNSLSENSVIGTISIDDIDTNKESLQGDVKVQLEHPDINDDWIQSFTISNDLNVTSITTDVTLNSQSASVTLYEDINRDGTADNSETLALSDGLNEYSLSSIDGGSGYNYWIEAKMNSSISETPVIKSLSLQNVGKWSTSSDWDSSQKENGVVHESVSNTDYNDASRVLKGISTQNLYNNPEVMCPLNEDSGSTAYNFGSYGNGSVQSGVTTGVDGIAGTTGYRFNGSNSSGNGINMGDIDIGAGGSITVLAWVKVQNFDSGTSTSGHFTDTHGQVIGKQGSGSGSTNDNYELGVLDNGSVGWYCDTGGDETIVESGSLSTSSWYMLAGTYDSSTGDLELYINGSSVGSSSISSGGLDSNGNSLGIGIAPGSNYSGNYFTFNGDIAFAHVWGKELSSASIQYIYDIIASESSIKTDIKTS